jgi:UPF0755 protein
VAALILVAAVITAAWIYWVNIPSGIEGSVDYEVKKGMTASDIAQELKELGLIKSTAYFRLIARFTGYEDDFKAAHHTLYGNMNVEDIAYQLTQNPPQPPDIVVTIPEGYSIREVARSIERQTHIDSVSFHNMAENSVFAAELGFEYDSVEGYLYPDTYFFKYNATARDMITRMVEQFHDVFNDSLKQRAEKIDMTVHEVVTLASIIENETNLDEERPLVSQVYHRRLDIGLQLAACPTVQYVLGEKRRLLNSDLTIRSPYNTYIHTGLPPGPIGSPGRASIIAALWPADTNYLYFAANGNGGNTFSRTHREHINAANRFRELRRRGLTD